MALRDDRVRGVERGRRRRGPDAAGRGARRDVRIRLSRVPRARCRAAVGRDPRVRVSRDRAAGHPAATPRVLCRRGGVFMAHRACPRGGFRSTAACGRAARRHLEQPARGSHVRSPDDRSLRRCAARSPVLALTARVDACAGGSDGLCRRPARESVRMGIDPVPVRERLRAAAAGDRRAAAGVPAVLQGVLRLRRAGGAAARVHAAPADRVGRPRCTLLRGPRLPLPEVHAARVPRHGADARGASHGVERARPRQPCRPRHRARWRPLRVASAALRVRDVARAPAASFPKRCCRRARSPLPAPKASPAPCSTATISAGG